MQSGGIHSVRWTSQKIADRLELLEKAIYKDREPIPPFRFWAGSDSSTGIGVDDGDWRVINPGEYWGSPREHFTLRSEFIVPSNWEPPASLLLPIGTTRSNDELAFLYGPEALLFIDEEPVQGVDKNHHEVLLDERYLDGQKHVIALSGWTGIGDGHFKMGSPAVVKIDAETRDFVATARVALGVAQELPENSSVRARLLNALDEAFRRIELQDAPGKRLYKSVERAHPGLRKQVRESGAALNGKITAVGHAHLDVAWLWSVQESRSKASRTFHTVLHLMEEFPDFHFSQSQPQLYEYMAQDSPGLFERIKGRVNEGRWEPLGGMWVEADCNITGGESLVRQFLLGRSYFAEHFGQDESQVLWLPDVFGYCWQLPQLMQEAGIRFFATAKLSWNQYNRFPYELFWWKGLDGTRILTYLITTQKPGWWGATYSAELTPKEILSTYEHIQQKATNDHILVPFGHGDGGGGPTRQMLENCRVMSSHPGLPEVHNRKVKDFFSELETAGSHELPEWDGELYLELHRGTYTTQAKTKRANRKSEFLLHNAEFLAAWAALRPGYIYPKAELEKAWKLLCLTQFHDILPGTSIEEVYDASAADYAEVREIGKRVCEGALEVLDHSLPPETDLVIYNPTSFSRHEILELGEDCLQGQCVWSLASDEVLDLQVTSRGALIEVPHVPPYGRVALSVEEGSPSATGSRVYAGEASGFESCVEPLEHSAFVIGNTLVQAEFNLEGDLIRFFDKRREREVLAEGEVGNQWQAFEDRPLDWDAWDIDVFYDDQLWLAEAASEIEITEAGPLRGCLSFKRRMLSSTIAQKVYLHKGSSRLDFETEVDWRERHVLLKVAFPVAILSPSATYETQWGNVERPTHRNTSWDWARFETCAHKWVDLSEGDYGVSLLNDCKYGHDIHGNVIRLSALRGTVFPDSSADLGHHVFTYSVLPHENDWRNETIAEAYALNIPLFARSTSPGVGSESDCAVESLVQANTASVVIETVKQAEDGTDVIVRLYECKRTRGPVQMRTCFPVSEAYKCSILEQDERELEVRDSEVSLAVNPYEIVTMRIVPNGSGKGKVG